MFLKNFVKRFQFEYLLNVLKETFARFPLSVVCAGVAAFLSILEVHDIGMFSDDTLQRVLLFLLYGLMFFTTLRLYVEGVKAPRERERVIALAGGAVLLALVFIPDNITAMHAFVCAALVLSMLFAPYIGRRSTEDSVWFYNYVNGVSLNVSGLSAFVLCIGLCAIIGSMDYLLYDMKLSKKIYGDIWIFGGLFFGPVMFMHQLPRKFDFEKSKFALLPGVHFIANYLVVPLILIYVWVLYVYFLKIAVRWELPKGNLAYMVTGFGSIGVAARLAVFSMRDSGTKLLQQFYRYFYYILIVPVILLAIGLYTRLSQYGMTEERYTIGICLVWLFALTVWHISKPKRAHIKHVPMILAALFLIGALGPWSAVSVSTRSQQARLEELLLKVGVLHADNTITKTTQDVPFKVRKDISSILRYMLNGKEKAIESWVAPFCKEIDGKHNNKKNTCHSLFHKKLGFQHRQGRYYDMPRKIMKAWGMQHVSRWKGADNERLNIRAPGLRNETLQRISPYDYMIHLDVSIRTSDWVNVQTINETVEYIYSGNAQKNLKIRIVMTPAGEMTLVFPDGRKVVFAVRPLADRLFKDKVRDVPKEALGKMVLRQESEGLSAELRISRIYGRVSQGTFKLEGIRALLLFSP